MGFNVTVMPLGLPLAVKAVRGDQLYVVKLADGVVTFNDVLLPLHIVADVGLMVNAGGGVTVAVTATRAPSQIFVTTRLKRYILSLASLPYQ